MKYKKIIPAIFAAALLLTSSGCGKPGKTARNPQNDFIRVECGWVKSSAGNIVVFETEDGNEYRIISRGFPVDGAYYTLFFDKNGTEDETDDLLTDVFRRVWYDGNPAPGIEMKW